jgi:two-component system nitrogen regulation sensor histidine kinase NtrY
LETLVDAQRSAHPRFPSLFQESAGAVLEEVERLRRIVDEFSRFARLPKPQLGPLDLGELAGQVLTLFASPRPGVQIRSDLQGALPIDGDRDQLTQVLVNLVKNAEEAMPGGGQLAVRAFARNGHAVLEVADSGPGIRPEDRKRIFEPYFTTKAGGTGLGLAIAARIAQEHGGQLEASGAPGGGALFSLSLPMRARQEGVSPPIG